MRLAPEGRPFVYVGAGILAVLVALALRFGGAWFAPAVVWLPVALWIPAFFRDPVRVGPRGDRLVLAPADGRVVSVAEVDEPDVIGGRALRIAVFMNVFNVHVNRHPVDGTVTHRDYRPGRFMNASLDKASEHNERMSLGVQQANGTVATEPTMDVEHVADAVLRMADLPLDVNVQFMTIMATKMPFIGRG